MGDFKVPNKHQRELLERNGICHEGVTVILENDSLLAMRNLKTGDEITLRKGEATKRREQSE